MCFILFPLSNNLSFILLMFSNLFPRVLFLPTLDKSPPTNFFFLSFSSLIYKAVDNSISGIQCSNFKPTQDVSIPLPWLKTPSLFLLWPISKYSGCTLLMIEVVTQICYRAIFIHILEPYERIEKWNCDKETNTDWQCFINSLDCQA